MHLKVTLPLIISISETNVSVVSHYDVTLWQFKVDLFEIISLKALVLWRWPLKSPHWTQMVINVPQVCLFLHPELIIGDCYSRFVDYHVIWREAPCANRTRVDTVQWILSNSWGMLITRGWEIQPEWIWNLNLLRERIATNTKMLMIKIPIKCFWNDLKILLSLLLFLLLL